MLDSAAATWGDREALVSCHQGVRKTFHQVHLVATPRLQVREEAEELAGGLVALGLGPGDRLGVWGPNSWEWYLTQVGEVEGLAHSQVVGSACPQMAAARLGAVLVNINPAYQPPELLYCLNKVRGIGW